MDTDRGVKRGLGGVGLEGYTNALFLSRVFQVRLDSIDTSNAMTTPKASINLTY